MRPFQLLGSMLSVIILLIGSIVYFNLDVFQSVHQNRDAIMEGGEWVEKTYSLRGLVDFMAAHPQYVSVVSYNIDKPEDGIYFQDMEKRIMGTTANLFLLTEYTRQVETGLLDRDLKIPFPEVERYYLPGIEESRKRTLARIITREELLTDDNTLRLTDIVSLMIRHNDPALADFLYFLLGPDNIEDLVEGLSAGAIEAPMPFSGLFISFQPDFNEKSFDEQFEELHSLGRSEFREYVKKKASQYIHDEAFREQVDKTFNNNGFGLRFAEERSMYDLFPKSEPRALAEILEKIANGELISRQVSETILHYLDWPMDDRHVQRSFSYYGAVYDNRISILNGIDIGISSLSGKQFVQVVMFEQLPIGFWMHMSSNHMNQDYQKRLIYDPELFTISRMILHGTSLN